MNKNLTHGLVLPSVLALSFLASSCGTPPKRGNVRGHWHDVLNEHGKTGPNYDVKDTPLGESLVPDEGTPGHAHGSEPSKSGWANLGRATLDDVRDFGAAVLDLKKKDHVFHYDGHKEPIRKATRTAPADRVKANKRPPKAIKPTNNRAVIVRPAYVPG